MVNPEQTSSSEIFKQVVHLSNHFEATLLLQALETVEHIRPRRKFVDLQKVKKRMEHHQEEPWQQYQKNLRRTQIFRKLPHKNLHLMEHTE